MIFFSLLAALPRTSFMEKYRSVLTLVSIAALVLILIHSIAIGAIVMKIEYVKIAVILLASLIVVLKAYFSLIIKK